MSKIQLVIDIDDEVYSHTKDYENRLITPNEENMIRRSVANGKPLIKWLEEMTEKIKRERGETF